MDLFRYLMVKNGHNYLKDDGLFDYVLAKGGGGTYAIFEGTSINANNTRRGKMKLTLKGNTSQTGTPTPSTPIPVNVVSGDNEVVVCGKNLLGLTNGTYSNNGITAIVNNGEITLNGVASGGTSVIVIDLINVIASSLGTLTKSLNPTGTYTGVQTSLRGSDKSIVGLYTDDASNKSETLTGDAYYLRIQVNENVSVNCTLKAQVELGNSSTPCEPYQSQTYPINLGTLELCKIGTYQDYFTKNSDGQWCKYNAIGKYTFDGTETNWGYNGETTNCSQFVLQKYDKKFGALDIICDKFQVKMTAIENAIAGRDTSNTVSITIAKSIVAYDMNAFKSWLSTNKPIMYYVLNTPYLSLIEDNNLIEQLDNLQNAMSYEGTTNINQINNDLAANLEAQISVNE